MFYNGKDHTGCRGCEVQIVKVHPVDAEGCGGFVEVRPWNDKAGRWSTFTIDCQPCDLSDSDPKIAEWIDRVRQEVTP